MSYLSVGFRALYMCSRSV